MRCRSPSRSSGRLVVRTVRRLPRSAGRVLSTGLAMNWRDLIPLAVRLAAGSNEADWRAAIGRAYYAAFHVSRQLFRSLGFAVPRAEQAHQFMIFRLNNCGDPATRQAGQNLDALRRLRNQADYDDAPTLTQTKAVAAVRLAEQVIRALDAAAQEPTRTQITDAMKLYEQSVLRVVTWTP